MTPILTPPERVSALWQTLSTHWKQRIDELHARLEGDLPEADTAKLRGRLAELRANLALGDDVPAATD